MKIRIVHPACGRESLVQQVIDANGHCPWDGKPFSTDYTAILTGALLAVEESGSTMENALEKIADMGPELTLRRESVLEPLSDQVDRLQRPRVQRT